MDLKEENAIGGDPMAHWYYIAKCRAIRSLIGSRQFDRVLDVGAGSGLAAIAAMLAFFASAKVIGDFAAVSQQCAPQTCRKNG